MSSITYSVIIILLIIIISLVGFDIYQKYIKKDSYYYPEDNNLYQSETRGITSTTAFTPPNMRP